MTSIASGNIPNTNLRVNINADGRVNIEVCDNETVLNNDYSNCISAVYDNISNKVVITYRNHSNNNGYSTAIVGTVSDNSISFGSPIVFNETNTNIISKVHASNNK